MLTIAIFLFVIAAAFGVILLTRVLGNKTTPKPVALIHGTLAVMALLITITYYVTGHHSTLVLTSIILFALAAVGGVIMFTLDISNKQIPKVIAVIHPLVAVTALVLLVVHILTQS